MYVDTFIKYLFPVLIMINIVFLRQTKIKPHTYILFEDEFNKVIFFLRYGRWVTRRVAVVTIAMIWLLAGLVSFLPISLGLHRPDEEALATQKPPRHPTCALVLTPTYAVVSSCISFILPCIVMISIYCR